MKLRNKQKYQSANEYMNATVYSACKSDRMSLQTVFDTLYSIYTMFENTYYYLDKMWNPNQHHLLHSKHFLFGNSSPLHLPLDRQLIGREPLIFLALVLAVRVIVDVALLCHCLQKDFLFN